MTARPAVQRRQRGVQRRLGELAVHPSEVAELAQLASLLGTSERTLQRLLPEGFRRWRDGYFMQYAFSRLWPVAEAGQPGTASSVAVELGYSSVSGFSAAFTRSVGAPTTVVDALIRIADVFPRLCKQFQAGETIARRRERLRVAATLSARFERGSRLLTDLGHGLLEARGIDASAITNWRPAVPQPAKAAIYENSRMRDQRMTDLPRAWAVFKGADVRGTDLSRSDLRNASFDSCDFAHAAFTQARLTGAELTRSRVRNTDFSEADLRWSRMRQVEGQGTSFVGADLRHADLRGVSLEDCDFVGADLRHANFRGATVTGSDFSLAETQGADFTGVDLTQVDPVGFGDMIGAPIPGSPDGLVLVEYNTIRAEVPQIQQHAFNFDELAQRADPERFALQSGGTHEAEDETLRDLVSAHPDWSDPEHFSDQSVAASDAVIAAVPGAERVWVDGEDHARCMVLLPSGRVVDLASARSRTPDEYSSLDSVLVTWPRFRVSEAHWAGPGDWVYRPVELFGTPNGGQEQLPTPTHPDVRSV